MITTKPKFDLIDKLKVPKVNNTIVTNDSLFTRTSWVDAKIALAQIEKVSS